MSDAKVITTHRYWEACLDYALELLSSSPEEMFGDYLINTKHDISFSYQDVVTEGFINKLSAVIDYQVDMIRLIQFLEGNPECYLSPKKIECHRIDCKWIKSCKGEIGVTIQKIENQYLLDFLALFYKEFGISRKLEYSSLWEAFYPRKKVPEEEILLVLRNALIYPLRDEGVASSHAEFRKEFYPLEWNFDRHVSLENRRSCVVTIQSVIDRSNQNIKTCFFKFLQDKGFRFLFAYHLVSYDEYFGTLMVPLFLDEAKKVHGKKTSGLDFISDSFLEDISKAQTADEIRWWNLIHDHVSKRFTVEHSHMNIYTFSRDLLIKISSTSNRIGNVEFYILDNNGIDIEFVESSRRLAGKNFISAEEKSFEKIISSVRENKISRAFSIDEEGIGDYRENGRSYSYSYVPVMGQDRPIGFLRISDGMGDFMPVDSGMVIFQSQVLSDMDMDNMKYLASSFGMFYQVWRKFVDDYKNSRRIFVRDRLSKMYKHDIKEDVRTFRESCFDIEEYAKLKKPVLLNTNFPSISERFWKVYDDVYELMFMSDSKLGTLMDCAEKWTYFYQHVISKCEIEIDGFKTGDYDLLAMFSFSPIGDKQRVSHAIDDENWSRHEVLMACVCELLLNARQRTPEGEKIQLYLSVRQQREGESSYYSLVTIRNPYTLDSQSVDYSQGIGLRLAKSLAADFDCRLESKQASSIMKSKLLWWEASLRAEVFRTKKRISG